MIVRVKDLVKRYGELTALDHLNLEIKEGDVFGLLGPNGSGKTTAINCILALLQFEKGEVQIFNQKMTPGSYQIKKDIGVVMQNVAVIPELSVYENIDYFCGLYTSDRATRKAQVEAAIEFVGLNDFVKFRPRKLSGGLLRRLNIACGIAHKPKLIILDEPTVAVDPQSRNNILEGIKKLNKDGATVIYTSHYMEEVELICSRIAIMDKGRVVAQGTKDELKNMIQIGEKIDIELLDRMCDSFEKELLAMPFVVDVLCDKQHIVIKTQQDSNGLNQVLNYFASRNVALGHVFSERPTLNDVFLEITGRELRDGNGNGKVE